MKNTFGNSVAVTIFGESHGAAVGAVIDGLAPGIPVDEDEIRFQLSRRRPSQATDTARREADNFSILSGVFGGYTTGTPICITIPNENTRSSDYNYGTARPSHADYTAYRKYHGYEDYRGGGHFSGRITAALVAVGGILTPALDNLGIVAATHILRSGDVTDRAFGDIRKDAKYLRNSLFPTLSTEAADGIKKRAAEAAADGDSIGGVTETVICGTAAGVGEPWFDSVESQLSHALYSIGGVKGVEFGLGFGFADGRGSECNDSFRTDGGSVFTTTNNSGGINGGITNGMPIVFRCAVRPTPSIAKAQDTVDFLHNENAEIAVSGRHDPAIIRRICPVIDSVAAIVICDMLAQRYGTDYLAGGNVR